MLCYRRDGQKGTERMDMRILSVINLKGGVAKTISSVAIAHLLAEKGFRVLLVDNDKQGDASRGYRRRDEDGAGIDEIMTARRPDMGSLIQHTDFPGLDIITANMKLLKANADPFKWMALPLHEFFAWIESVNEVEEEDKAARKDK